MSNVKMGDHHSKFKEGTIMFDIMHDIPDVRYIRPLCIVGSLGVGRTTFYEHLRAHYGDKLMLSIRSTTRKPNEGEKEGVNFYFISKEHF
jgi:guanylate kinase